MLLNLCFHMAMTSAVFVGGITLTNYQLVCQAVGTRAEAPRAGRAAWCRGGVVPKAEKGGLGPPWKVGGGGGWQDNQVQTQGEGQQISLHDLPLEWRLGQLLGCGVLHASTAPGSSSLGINHQPSSIQVGITLHYSSLSTLLWMGVKARVLHKELSWRPPPSQEGEPALPAPRPMLR